MSKMHNSELVYAVINLLDGAKFVPTDDDFIGRYSMRFNWHGLNWIVSNDNCNTSKFLIRVSWPRYRPEGNVYQLDKRWKELTTEIGVSNTKTAERIVADIKRRFDIAALLSIANEYLQANEDQIKLIADSKAIAQKLVKATGWRLYSSQHDDTEHEISNGYDTGCHIELKVRGRSVSVKVDSTVDETKALELASKLSAMFA